MQPIFNPTFQIQPEALAIANLLNAYALAPDRHVHSYPYYNGREQVICLIAGKNAVTNKVIAIERPLPE